MIKHNFSISFVNDTHNNKRNGKSFAREERQPIDFWVGVESMNAL